MSSQAQKVILPQYVVTEIVARPEGAPPYRHEPKMVQGESVRRDGKPVWVPSRFNLYPVILCGDGSPWPEANMWILTTLEGKVQPKMSGFSSIAEDLAAFRRFIEDYDLDWLSFPERKLDRPTYRFNGHLRNLIMNLEVSASTAKRRMATIVRFYRWMIAEKLFEPANVSWRERDHYVEIKGQYGQSSHMAVKTTDVSISTPKQDDPYDGRIDDGGKLRPLSQQEQEWLVDALTSLRNTEMTLIHLFGMLTGARIQTIGTFRVKDVVKTHSKDHEGYIRVPVGRGTGIDTKYDKQQVLFIPAWFMAMLRTYALSQRAKTRRDRAVGGDTPEQYLFLSIRGTPFYEAQSPVHAGDSPVLRHAKVGQGVRQYMTDYILPFIRNKYDKSFHYQFHDTRATYGMNMVDEKLALVEKGEMKLSEVMEYVKTRMGHASSATTERYLTFRSRLKLVRKAQDGWEERLELMARQAMEKSDAAAS